SRGDKVLLAVKPGLTRYLLLSENQIRDNSQISSTDAAIPAVFRSCLCSQQNTIAPEGKLRKSLLRSSRILHQCLLRRVLKVVGDLPVAIAVRLQPRADEAGHGRIGKDIGAALNDPRATMLNSTTAFLGD